MLCTTASPYKRYGVLTMGQKPASNQYRKNGHCRDSSVQNSRVRHRGTRSCKSRAVARICVLFRIHCSHFVYLPSLMCILYLSRVHLSTNKIQYFLFFSVSIFVDSAQCFMTVFGKSPLKPGIQWEYRRFFRTPRLPHRQ